MALRAREVLQEQENRQSQPADGKQETCIHPFASKVPDVRFDPWRRCKTGEIGWGKIDGGIHFLLLFYPLRCCGIGLDCYTLETWDIFLKNCACSWLRNTIIRQLSTRNLSHRCTKQSNNVFLLVLRKHWTLRKKVLFLWLLTQKRIFKLLKTATETNSIKKKQKKTVALHSV